MNTMMALMLYRHQGCWVFTDDEHNLKHEALVLGASEMVDRLYAAETGKYTRDPVKAIFSATPFPGAHCATWVRPEEDGNWYTLAGQSAWLCGSLLSYFPDGAPPLLYVRITDA